MSTNTSVNSKNTNLQQLVLCAILIALAYVLGLIKIFNLPFGGSITLFSMLPAVLCGYICGTKKGVLACVALGLLNLAIGGYVLHPVQLILDYILAFGAMGLSGLVANKKNGLTLGYIIAVVGRFFFAFLSGVIFFASYAPEGMNPVVYSIVYQAIYLGTEGILTIILINIPAVKVALEKLKVQFN